MKRLITLGLCLLAPITSGVAFAQNNPTSTPAKKTTGTTPTAQNYLALGKYYYNSGRYDAAYAAFRTALELDKKNKDVLLYLGRTQVQLKLYSAAQDTFKQLRALDSRNVSAYIGLAQTYRYQYISAKDLSTVKNNLDEALNILEEAERVSPTSASVFNERALVYNLKGDDSKALESARKASELAKDDAIILANYARLQYEAGNMNGALDTLQQAVIADPTDPINRALYARLLAEKGDIKAANLEIAQALRFKPQTATVLGYAGIVNYLAKDLSNAKTNLTQAVQKDPARYPEFYFYLGRIALDGGNSKEAHANFTKAVTLNGTNAEFRFYFAKSLEAIGDKANARTQYQKALELNKGYKDAQEALDRLK
ncbi:tetratricopeptide repeat protein [Deinococcus roseus]|uniref:Tetratricopeptide repeat protein n=1 Tax=Deinococcus roseus TaxID=392414 RepID=A0ABQ2CWA5_9DEIO|nr:tetratricopeptide repeat protein [Deinococcus roseus]GGJ23399.1 hypothetical protein GCM10008938_06950 [Deinococcus roseus]